MSFSMRCNNAVNALISLLQSVLSTLSESINFPLCNSYASFTGKWGCWPEWWLLWRQPHVSPGAWRSKWRHSDAVGTRSIFSLGRGARRGLQPHSNGRLQWAGWHRTYYNQLYYANSLASFKAINPQRGTLLRGTGSRESIRNSSTILVLV